MKQVPHSDTNLRHLLSPVDIHSDVNCQKVFGAFFSIISAMLGLQTFFLYQNQCFKSFRQGEYCFDENRELTECSADNPAFDIEIDFQWYAGTALYGLGVATFAKILDLLCNIIIPTPSITRSREEQEEYERQVGLLDEDVKQEEMERGDDEEDGEPVEEENN